MESSIKIIENNLTEDELKHNLKSLCNTILKIAKQQKERNIDVSNCFIKTSEYEKLKKENPENFI